MFSDRGFRFRATYQAPKSGYQIELLSQGFVKQGNDLSDNAFAIIQICPLAQNHGRPLRFCLLSEPDRWLQMLSSNLDLPQQDWNWRTSLKLFRQELLMAGYSELDTAEVSGSVKVIGSALSGSKGVILEGQIESVKVVNTIIYCDYKFDRNQPVIQWIKSEDLEPCILD